MFQSLFKAALNVLQANAVPFLVPSPTRWVSRPQNQSLRLPESSCHDIIFIATEVRQNDLADLG
jgi:hypothetical protein